MIELISAELGVSCRNLMLHVSVIRGTHYSFKLEDGKLVSDPKNSDVTATHLEAKHEMIAASAKFLIEVKAALNLT